MKKLRTVGMIFYSIVAASAVITVFAHAWKVQRELIHERRLGAEFRNA